MKKAYALSGFVAGHLCGSMMSIAEQVITQRHWHFCICSIHTKAQVIILGEESRRWTASLELIEDKDLGERLQTYWRGKSGDKANQKLKKADRPLEKLFYTWGKPTEHVCTLTNALLYTDIISFLQASAQQETYWWPQSSLGFNALFKGIQAYIKEVILMMTFLVCGV